MASSESDSQSPADDDRTSSPDGASPSDNDAESLQSAGTVGTVDDAASDSSGDPGSSDGDAPSELAADTAAGSGSDDREESVLGDSPSEPAADTAAESGSEDDPDGSSSAGSPENPPASPGSPSDSPSCPTSSSCPSSPSSHPFCLWELCCAPDSQLVAAVREGGDDAQRLTLETGYDMQCPTATRRAKRRIKASRKFPRGWASPPCTKWSSMQNLTKKTRKRARALRRARRKSRALVANCVEVLLAILGKRGHFYYEWPHSCQGWQIPELRQLRQEAREAGQDVFEVLFEGCAFGLRDSSRNFFLRKRWRVLTNAPGLRDVARQCPFQGRDGPGHLHKTIQGKETARSAFYPPRMCRALARHWQQHHCSHRSFDTPGSRG